MPIRCLIIDDSCVRESLRGVLQSESDIQVVGESNDPIGFLQTMAALEPDIVLLNLGVQAAPSLEAARWIQRNLPQTRLIFLAAHEDEQRLQQCFESGADGCLLKDSSPGRLVSAIREVYQGRKYLSPQILGRMVDDFRSRSIQLPPRTVKLTPREREVVGMLAEGKTVREIAHLLGLSSKTVDAHKFNLMRKLDIHNKAQLVAYAVQRKIVKVPDGA